jgi:hypothetical protein
MIVFRTFVAQTVFIDAYSKFFLEKYHPALGELLPTLVSLPRF